MMEHQKYDWKTTTSKIHSWPNKISYLADLIYEKENDYEDLCDLNMELTNELMQLEDSRFQNFKEYDNIKRKRTDVIIQLRELATEQEDLDIFYNQQFLLFQTVLEDDLDNSLNYKDFKIPRPPDRFPGKRLTTQEKLFLLELLVNNDALKAISSKGLLEQTLPYITGISLTALEGNLKDYPGWFLSTACDVKSIPDRINSLENIKKIMKKAIQDPISKLIIKELEAKIHRFENSIIK